MKERPILFQGAMVRALLAGTKTQTRRVVKPQPDHLQPENLPRQHHLAGALRCPYGQPGDRLWVREAFSGPHCMEAGEGFSAVPPSKWGCGSRIWYWADGEPEYGDWTKPRPSIHMPRWASRITLEITAVRVERLQEISEADAAAEGVDEWGRGALSPESQAADPTDKFRWLWGSINGDTSWFDNPWVWVVELRRVQP